MREPTRKEEIIITMTLDLRGEREFTLPGLRNHKVVEVAWLTKSTNSHPVTVVAMRSNGVACVLSLRFVELPEEIKQALLRNMHVGDVPSESWYPTPPIPSRLEGEARRLGMEY